jgi:hypothetical protein
MKTQAVVGGIGGILLIASSLAPAFLGLPPSPSVGCLEA